LPSRLVPTPHHQQPTAQEAQMPDNTPVLDSLAALNAVSLAEGTLEPREHMLARLAALVAVGAPDASYLLNAGAAADAGVTVEDVQGVLIAVAPIVGTPRVLAGAAGITRALGFAVAVAEAEIAAMLAEAESAESTPS
jgi:alkylhydroperoxidase/carboxymuconolactone decarboxylase family protein YurZ